MNDQQRLKVQGRIRAAVTEDNDSGCWLWSRQISNSGYGRITLAGDDGTYMESAHRASYLAFIGPLPKAGVIRQSCGNRLCVKPDHLVVTAT